LFGLIPALIIQEAVLARRIMILCEDHILPWSVVSTTVVFLKTTTWGDLMDLEHFRMYRIIPRRPKHYRDLLKGGEDLSMLCGAVHIESIRSLIERQDGQLLTLRALLGKSRSTHVREPVDKIYAILGLARKDSC